MISKENASNSSQVPETTEKTFKHCSACGASLKPRLVCDILVYGAECADGHKFFVPLQTVKPPNHEGKFLSLRSDKVDRDEIAKDWLTNPALRPHLNNSVAETLRIFLEIKAGTHNEDKQHEAYHTLRINKFCPKCGELARSVGGDGYMVDHRCGGGHQFSERGYALWFINDPLLPDGSYLQLCLDIDYHPRVSAANFIANQQWQRSIASQVCEILAEYADEFLKR